MELSDFKKTIEDYRNRAVNIACLLKGYNSANVDYVVIDEEEVEVVFEWDSGCSCCSNETDTIYIPIEDLFQDIDELITKKEQERAEVKRKKDEAAEFKKQKESEAIEKRDKTNYERLK